MSYLRATVNAVRLERARRRAEKQGQKFIHYIARVDVGKADDPSYREAHSQAARRSVRKAFERL